MLSGRRAQLSSCIIFPSILGNRFPSLLLEMFLKALKRRWHECYLWKGVPVVLFWSLALGCVLSLLLFSTAQTMKWKSRVTSKYFFQDKFAVAGVLRQLIWFVTDLWPEKVPEEMILCTSCCVLLRAAVKSPSWTQLMIFSTLSSRYLLMVIQMMTGLNLFEARGQWDPHGEEGKYIPQCDNWWLMSASSFPPGQMYFMLLK